MSTASAADDHAYCADLVRNGDPDRFACLMLAPAKARANLCALYAFNLEVSRTREAVREALLGEIRLQWWRDAIGECFDGTPRRHQVVQPLKMAIDGSGLPRDMLERVVDARAADLYPEPPANAAALEKYIGETGGLIGVLATRCVLGPDIGEGQLSAAHLVGRAWAWTGLARGLVALHRQGRHIVPPDIIAAYPGWQDELDTGQIGNGVRTVVRHFSEQAESCLSEWRMVKSDAGDPADLHVNGIAILASRYLRRLEKAGYDPSKPGCAQMGAGARAWHLLPVGLRSGS